MTSDAYRNLHKACISVKEGSPKCVRRCVQQIELSDVKFVVGDAGRKRVRREKRKNVHAYVRGTPKKRRRTKGLCAVEVTYDPYKYKTFVTREGKRPIHDAEFAVVRPDGVTAYRKCR